MKCKKLIAISVCFVMAFSLFTGCTSKPATGGTTNSKSATAGTIKIGASCPISGASAADGLKMQQGIQLAVNEINANGGVLGKKIQLDIQDDQATQTGAVNSVSKLISDGVVGVIGPHMSTSVQATDSIFEKAGIPYLTGGTSPSLETTKDPYFHRVRPSDTLSAEALGKFVLENLGAKKIGILYDNDSFGSGGNSVLVSVFKAANASYLSEGYNTGDKDFSADLAKMKNFGVDTICVWGHDTETAEIAQQISQLGMNVKKASANTMSMVEVIQMAGASANGWYSIADYVSTATSNPLQNTFVKDFKAKYNAETDLYSSAYYSATYILVNAIKSANSTDPAKINDALSKLSGYNGLLGTYSSDSNGDMIHQTNIVQIENMQPVLVEPVKIS